MQIIDRLPKFRARSTQRALGDGGCEPQRLLLGHEGVEPLVMRFDRHMVGFLAGIGDADGDDRLFGAKGRERGVIDAAAIAQPKTAPIEGGERRKYNIGIICRLVVGGLGQAERAL